MSHSKPEKLDEQQFIRHRLYGGEKRSWRRYAELVLVRPSLPGLLKYELLTILFGFLPGAPGLALRKLFFPLLIGRNGKGTVYGRSITLRHGENMQLGDGVVIDDYCVLDARGCADGEFVVGERVILNRGASVQAKVGGIRIGDETSIGANVRIISQGPIRIGRQVSIAGDVTIAGGRFVVERDDDAKPGDTGRFTTGAIEIGDKARIGTRSVIEDNVSIGIGAIVAPGSVVLTDVPDYEVVAGNPARPWRPRKSKSERDTDREFGDAQPRGDAADDHEIRDSVRAHLAETHFASFGPGELSDSDSLFDNEILDSVGLVSLITWIETTYGVSLPEEELVPQRLETVERIEQLIREARKASTTR